jgi:hypothetical protein
MHGQNYSHHHQTIKLSVFLADPEDQGSVPDAGLAPGWLDLLQRDSLSNKKLSQVLCHSQACR